VLVGCGSTRGHLVSAPWELRSAVDPTTTVLPLTVYVGSSSCDRLEDVRAVETADSVAVTANVRSSAGSGGCTSDMRVARVEVSLTAPLGGRQLSGCGARPGYPGETRDCLTPGASGF
jgi:hypothetical protein